MASKILVVDDEAPLRDLFKDLFKKENYAVKCVSTGEEAVSLVTKEDFNIVLLDIRLTGMNGLEALKKIKEIKPDLAVVMITGFGFDEELIAQSKAYGCAGYIGKNMPVLQMMNIFHSLVKKEKAK